MDRPGCEKEGGQGSEVTDGSGLLEWGVGVMSMGVSELRGWRLLTVFSKLSSFCSTVVETSFSSMETSFSSMTWLLARMFLILLLVAVLVWCICSNSFV